MKYQIYKITNLLEPQRVYIGMTSQTLKRRFNKHCTSKKSAIYEPIQRAGKEHFEIMPIDHAHNKNEAFCKEEFWTMFYIERGFDLYNIDIGKRHTDETRFKISKENKGKHPHSGEKNPMYEKHHTEEARRKISESRKGKPLSEAHKKKLSELRKGEKHPMYGKRFSDAVRKRMSDGHTRKRPVQCIETNQLFPCLLEAERQTNINSSSIMRVCKGRNKTAGGYHWKFVEE